MKVFQALERLVGRSSRIINTYVATILNPDSDTYTAEFKDYLTKQKVDIDILTEDEKDSAELAKHIKLFCESKKIKPALVSDLDKVNIFNYGSVQDREEGIRHFGDVVLDIFQELDNAGTLPKTNVIDTLVNKAKSKWISIILNRIATVQNRELKDVSKEYIQLIKDSTPVERSKWMAKQLGDSLTIQEQNLLAVYKELSIDSLTGGEFIVRTMAAQKLQFISGAGTIDAETNVNMQLANSNKADSGIDLDGNITVDEDVLDTYFTDLNHFGEYSTFTMHLGERIANYFNTLPVLSDWHTIEGKYQYDTNNAYGIADRMNAREVTAMLFSIAYRFTTPESTIEAIREVAKYVKGFECFTKLADDLDKNKDFATEFRTVFAKTVISKMQLRVSGSITSAIRANERSDRYSVMVYNLFSDTRKTCLDVDTMYAFDLSEKLDSIISSVRKQLKNDRNTDVTNELNEATNLLVSFVRMYFPSIDEVAIRTFVKANTNNLGQVNQFDNIVSLTKSMNAVLKETKNLRASYESLEKKKKKAKSNYRYYKQLEADGIYVSEEKYIANRKVYSEDFITTGQTAIVLGLAKKLMPFSVVRLQLNSHNVYGNNSSDVINNSYITRITKLFQNSYRDEHNRLRNEALERWGRKKLGKGTQYKYSSILLEQRDKNGIISYGIFRKLDDGTLVLTEQAPELLKTFLFDGSTFFDKGTNCVYKDMEEGAYMPTAYMAFMNTTRVYATDIADTEIPTANYFCRTPSDAPKNFVIRSARYSSNGLFYLSDKEEPNKIAKQVIADLTQLSSNIGNSAFIKSLNANIKSSIGYDKQLELVNLIPNVLISPKKNYISITNENCYVRVNAKEPIKETTGEINVDENGDSAIVRCDIEIGGITRSYIFVGDYKVSKKNTKYITNAKLLGTINITREHEGKPVRKGLHRQYEQKLSEYVQKAVQTRNVTVNGKVYNKVTYLVDRTHPLFRMLKNSAKQELLDCAKAINHYFDNDNGLIKDCDDENKYQDKVIKVRKNKDNSVGFANYHLSKSGKVIEGEPGNYTLGGQVFKTNHFTLEHIEIDAEGNETIEPKNYIGELISTKYVKEGEQDAPINLLYGKTRDNYLNTVKSGDDVIDIYLTPDQEEALDAKLEEFIFDYVEQTERAINAKKDFIHNTPITKESIADFALNYLIFYFNSDDIFEGSSKFYKSAQDLLKRAKEIQGSGVPYGIADYLGTDGEESKEVEWSYLNSGTILINKKEVSVQDYLKSLGITVKQQSKFVAITIQNSKVKDNEATIKRLKAMLLNGGVPEAKADSMLNGFKGTKVNDAQSYITFEEWIRRIAARGQLQKHMPLIAKIQDRRKPLTASDLKAFVQLQKNFYYDLSYNEEYDMETPRQIKNAELVLIPRFIEGTELEKLYDFMKRNGIDQINTVETSKASNEEVITIWDNDTNLVNLDNVEAYIQEKPHLKQIYDYTYLYTQQEAHQHVDAENKAGVQIMKKIIDNICEPPASLADNNPALYKELKDLYDKKMQFILIFCQNIRSAYDDVVKSLNIKTDKEGNIILNDDGLIDNLDTEMYFDRFREELFRIGCDVNLTDYVTLEDGKPRMPLYISMSIRKLESVAQNLFNSSITRQKLPGFHTVQTTSVGWKKISDKSTEGYSDELYFHPMTYKSKVIDQREYNKLDNKKIWVENGPAPYIEVMLPKSNFGVNMNSAHYMNMSDEEILEELKANKLDTVIGYRIPTEGKQSVCMMKVVGFIDDAYGSTLVVPNDWVSQTGSSFNFDTVYGIQADKYAGSTGEITRANWIGDTPIDWYLYVKRESGNKYLKFGVKKEEAIELTDDIQKEFDKEYKKLQEINTENWKKLNKTVQDGFKKLDATIVLDSKLTKKENYKNRLIKHLEYIEKVRINNIENLTKKYRMTKEAAAAFFDKSPTYKNELQPYAESIKNIINFLDTQTNDFASKKSEKLNEIINDRLQSIQNIAKQNNLLSYEEFRDAVRNNRAHALATTKQRNTKLFDLMCEILSSKYTVEEQLSRSNFEDVIKWRDRIMNENVKKRRAARSAYNVIDQIAYQQDAMSGAKLKGISVMLDTFNSVCNTVRPTLTTPITIVYDTKDYITPDNAKNANQIIGRFGTGAEINGNRFYITHNKYGWSNQDGNGDRNVAGALITPYSSETTAHILDAIKEGIVPGVNAYTFATYKTFLNIGSDFNAAISFIMQPGVLRVGREYEKNNSVFATSYGNPIENSIKALAKQLGLDVLYATPIVTVFSQLNEKYGDVLNTVLNVFHEDNIAFSLSEDACAKLPIVISLMKDRIKEQGIFKNGLHKRNSENEDVVATPEEVKAVFDIAVICIFNRIHRIASKIMGIVSCCNPDKFGAKQSVFATYEVIENIQTIVQEKPEDWVLQVQDKNTGVGVHILEGIYPGITQSTLSDPIRGMRNKRIEDSYYPTLYAFLRYSTCSSIFVNRSLFDTQAEPFVRAIRGVTSVFSGYNPKLGEKEYNEVQTYFLNYLYTHVPSIEQPIEIKDGKIVIPDKQKLDEDNIASVTESNNEALKERVRIYGFGHYSGLHLSSIEEHTEEVEEDVKGKKRKVIKKVQQTVFNPVEIKDINNPTDEELKEFAKFSPAQKVLWIQVHFNTTNTIFDYLTVQLYNSGIRGRLAGTQTIEITNTSADENKMILLHKEAFFSDNPLKRLAAIDMVKYAIIFENYHLTYNGISKIISNAALLSPVEELGLGFIDFMNEIVRDIKRGTCSIFNENNHKTIYENYLRSHPKTKGIKTIKYTDINAKRYSLTSLEGDAFRVRFYLPSTTSSDLIADLVATWQDQMVNAGIKYKDPIKNEYKFNKYVRIIRNGNNTLYKIEVISNEECMLYPLNPVDINECATSVEIQLAASDKISHSRVR